MANSLSREIANQGCEDGQKKLTNKTAEEVPPWSRQQQLLGGWDQKQNSRRSTALEPSTAVNGRVGSLTKQQKKYRLGAVNSSYWAGGITNKTAEEVPPWSRQQQLLGGWDH